MKAIILCNNNESALLPVTATTSKYLLPICGKAAIKYILDSINNYDISDCIIVYDDNLDKLKQISLDKQYKNVKLEFISTNELLEYDFDEDVIFISDIMLFDFNLNDACEYHKSNNGFATLIVKPVELKKNIETVIIDNNSKIETFLNKQSNNGYYSSLANTGIWIISAEKCNNFFSSYSEKLRISPKDYDLFAYSDSGYWQNISTAKDFLKCHHDILTSKAPFESGGHKMLDGIITADLHNHTKNGQINPPVYIGKNVSIGEGTVIDSNTVIGNNVTIGRNVKLHGAIIMNGVYIGDRTECTDCIICQNATVLNSAIINESCIIGEAAVIGENSIVENGVKVWNNKHLERNTVASYDIRYGHAQPLHIGEEGIYGETNGEISAFTAVKTGMSLVNAGKNIAVGYKPGSNASRCCAMALCSGIASAGGNAMLVGECLETELAFLTRECKQELGAYIEANAVTKIKLISKDGLSLDRCCENAIEAGLNGHVIPRASYFTFGDIINAEQMRRLYELKLIEMNSDNNKVGFDISTSNKNIKKHFQKIIKPSPSSSLDRIIFQISSDGKKASAYSSETGFVFHEKLVAICCKHLFEQGQDVALPYSFSLTIDDIASKFGRKVLRYHDCSDNASDIAARKLAGKLLFPFDGLILMLQIVKILNEKEIKFSELIQEVPQTFTSSRFVSCQDKNFNFIRQFTKYTEFRGDGIWVRDKKGEVFIRPSKAGNSVRIFAESFSSETAAELCDSYENIIKNKFPS